MSTLYDKVYKLFNSWLSDEVEDYATFSQILDNQFIYVNGDCYTTSIEYYNFGKNFWELLNPQSALLSSENDTIKITTNSSGEKKVNLPVLFSSTDNCFVEMTANGGSSQPIALSFNNTSNGSLGYLSHDGASTFNNALGSSSVSVTGSVDYGSDVFRLVRLNGTNYFYQNDKLIFKGTKSFSSSFFLGFYTNSNRVQYWSNIIVGRIV